MSPMPGAGPVPEIITLQTYSKTQYLSQWFVWFRSCFVGFILSFSSYVLGLSCFYSRLCRHPFWLRRFIPGCCPLSLLLYFYIFSLGQLLLLHFFRCLLNSKCSAEKGQSVHLQGQTHR